MKVYVLTSEPARDNSVLYGVYASLEGAKAGVQDETWTEQSNGEWETTPKKSDRWSCYMIQEAEVQP